MKNYFFTLFFLAAFGISHAQVGINTPTPDASAALDVSSTTQGMLPPRMTESQRDMIASPATGLLVFQTDGTAGYYFYDGTAWTSLSGGGGSGGGIQNVTEAAKNAMTTAANGTLVYQTDGYKGIYAKESDGWRSQSGDLPITFYNIGVLSGPYTGTVHLLNASHHMIIVEGEWSDTPFDVELFTLPDASTCQGRIYTFYIFNDDLDDYAGFGEPFEENGLGVVFSNPDAYIRTDRYTTDTDAVRKISMLPSQRRISIQSDGTDWREVAQEKPDAYQLYLTPNDETGY